MEISELKNEEHLKKLRFRCWHRGFKEADIILGNFADKRLAGLSSQDLVDFETLIGQPDREIYNWITQKEPVPSAFDKPIMGMLKNFDYLDRS